MFFVSDIQNNLRNKLPDNYEDMSMYDRLYFKRSMIPAITHVDFSAKIQSVNKQTNQKY